MPYIVLEAAAAQKPLIATRVGGIPEIIEPDTLIAPNDPQALIAAMAAELDGSREAPDPQALAATLRDRFSREAMTQSVAEAYRQTRAQLARSPVPVIRESIS